MTGKQIIHDLEALRAAFLEERNAEPMCLGEAIKLIKALEERPQGKWSECFDKKTYFIGWKCSRCEKICKGIFNYCPNCGAKMGGKEADNEHL